MMLQVSSVFDCSGNTNIMSNLVGFENDIFIGNFNVADDASFCTRLFNAKLNSLQNILIRSSITQSCSYLNKNSDNIIACITPQTGPYGALFILAQ